MAGVLLLFASLVAALVIQFLGGGLVDVVDAHETGPGANGGSGGFMISMVLTHISQINFTRPCY